VILGDPKVARSEIHIMRGAFALIGKREISGLCASIRSAGAGDSAAFAREFDRYGHGTNETLVRRAADASKSSSDTLSHTSVIKRRCGRLARMPRIH